ncbi:hypothetical protein CQA53_10445 [Helicobacter didelphidarum]|uniref:Uncharacterized protein n=1 Tax=Helicobacter didelphidarum TaxID=2040648 RepID=A0A3D8I7U7_9HELI|nr:hypothetical protein [Helicobacter didelphidarum]RDU61243.1 hypothetical protein CQA53_10445 [Helicobacter didelphidarum]
MKRLLFAVSLVCFIYADNLPKYVKSWQGKVYTSTSNVNGKDITQIFKIDDFCVKSDGILNDRDLFGENYCEIGYSYNGSAFDDWNVNFYIEKPNDMNYGLVRVISIESATKAVIKVVSMEYANDFCNIEVTKDEDIITLHPSKCKIDDLVLHNNIFHTYHQE